MKPYVQVALFFAITQLLGIYAGVVLINGAATNPDIQSLSVAPIPEQNDPLNAVFFIVYILAGAVMIILAARFFKGMLFFQLLEFMVVSSASSIVFFAAALAILGMDFLSAIGTSCGFARGIHFSHSLSYFRV